MEIAARFHGAYRPAQKERSPTSKIRSASRGAGADTPGDETAPSFRPLYKSRTVSIASRETSERSSNLRARLATDPSKSVSSSPLISADGPSNLGIRSDLKRLDTANVRDTSDMIRIYNVFERVTKFRALNDSLELKSVESLKGFESLGFEWSRMSSESW